MPKATLPQPRRAAIALGANLGDRHATLERAISLIAQNVGPIERRSAWLETPALIHPDDPATTYPDFLNGVVLVRSCHGATALLAELHWIERSLGRNRETETTRWRPRLIDLDLIALEEETIDQRELTVPHPEMHHRDFVLAPLCEVWPDWRHPLLGRTAAELLAELRRDQR